VTYQAAVTGGNLLSRVEHETRCSATPDVDQKRKFSMQIRSTETCNSNVT
jgi:hypothetical protein